MIDALGRPGHVLLLGGTSDLAVATTHRWARDGLHVTVAARPSDRRDAVVADLESAGCTVAALDFEATDPHATQGVLAQVEQDVDISVVAFGILGDHEASWTDVDAAREIATINYTAAVCAGVALAERIRAQGHGLIVALSSVAGERPRRSNFVYGSTKAGMDAFYVGLTEALREHGGRVLVVRLGFVHTKMTDGLEPAPFATTPDVVADAIVEAVRDGREQIWVPRTLRGVMSALRHLPRPVFRRIPS